MDGYTHVTERPRRKFDTWYNVIVRTSDGDRSAAGATTTSASLVIHQSRPVLTLSSKR